MIGLWRYCETSWWKEGCLCKGLRILAVKFALVAAIFFTACQEEILHDLSEREANKALSHLSMARLDAKKVLQADGRWAIAVARDEMVPALTHLDSQRVLASRGGGTQAIKGSMIPSREEQWFRFERSLASSIEESLAAIPGVLEARVHVNVPEEDPLFASSERAGGSGSVLLVVDDSFSAKDEEIAALVAGATGIPRGVVQVLKTQAPPIYVAEPKPTLPSAETRPILRSYTGIPWVGPLGVCAVIAIGLGARHIVTRRRKRVTFAIPKELDFEG